MKDKVLKLISNQFNVPVEKLNENMSFKEDLNADSIDLVQLIMTIEAEFNVDTRDEDLDSIKTIGDCLKYIDKMN